MQLQYNVLDDEDCATAVLLLVSYRVLGIGCIIFYFIIIFMRCLSPNGLPGHDTRPFATARPIGRLTVSYAVSTTDRRSAHRAATNLLPPTTTVTHSTHHSTIPSLPDDYVLIYYVYKYILTIHYVSCGTKKKLLTAVLPKKKKWRFIACIQ